MKAKRFSELSFEEQRIFCEKEHEEKVRKAMHKKNKNWDEMTDEEIGALSNEELKRLQTEELVNKVEKWKHIFVLSVIFNAMFLYNIILMYKSPIVASFIPICLTVLFLVFVRISIRFHKNWDSAKFDYRGLLAFFDVNGI
jgi:hypothetical protein